MANGDDDVTTHVQEFVPFPDLNRSNDDDIYGGDPTLWNDYIDATDTADSDELLMDDSPFYANQEEDPRVQQIQYDFDQYIDGLFKWVTKFIFLIGKPAFHIEKHLICKED